jgi:DNA-binding NarL/FixJ family response regulator
MMMRSTLLGRNAAVAEIRLRLGAEAFADAWAAGRALSLDEAVAEALALTISEVTPRASSTRAAPAAPAGLTARELDVLRLIVEGRSDREIAETLFISHRTVQGHVSGIFTKLGVSSRTAAATAAIRAGIVPPETGSPA